MKPISREFQSSDSHEHKKWMYSLSRSTQCKVNSKMSNCHILLWRGTRVQFKKSCIAQETTSQTLAEAAPNHRRTWSRQEFQWPQNGLCCTTTTWSRWWYIAQVITDLTTEIHASRKRPPTLISTGTFVESFSSYSFLTHAGINHTGQLKLPRERNDLRGIFNTSPTLKTKI